ncbi:Ger(x)C family spore germination protein [Ureibacillus aquaedulcis]|uniref:Ger(X)C family spore germination protein n=1 Tax=Ureibacillus aquaedulcis TaxID=3058421 RepID=A0ABT8GW67_9BACL|nr:Ger(x)C family spore germination protein [Ureibacillus sp. BA0131]MDN4495616.1 Ger(x)C family spore germination protein [Ureibacillus sp. BA0131]
MNSLKVSALFLVAVMILAGCTNQKILERTSLTTLLSYDKAEDDKITTTAVIRQINPDLESKVEIQSATEATNRGGLVNIELKTSKKIGAGQLRVALFGEELAKSGLNDFIHTLKMNPEISNGIYLGVVEGDAKSLIDSSYKNITDIGQHIFQLIDHNIEQNHALSPTLHEVNRDNTSQLANFSLPILKKEGEYIEISGIAFFLEAKMVGRLPSQDLLYAKMIRNDFSDGALELAIPSSTIESFSEGSDKEVKIAIDSINSSRKIKLVDKTVPEFDFTLNLEARLLEIHSGLRITTIEEEKKLEKAINKKIESELNRVIQYSQEVNSDIFRFGEHYKAQVRKANITEEKWHEMYPEMKVNVTVKTLIVRDGVFQ